jgi:hypothetical protein
MGFLGLQTKNSNTMDKVSTNAKTALFDSFGTSIDSANHYGSLYQFNNGGDAAAARANLVNLVTKDLETPTVARIYQYRDFINNQTGGLFTNSGTDTAIQNATTNEEKRQVLIDAIKKTGEQPADFILPDGCFVGYNKNTNAHGPTYELNYHGSGPIIPDDTTGDKAEGSRVTIMQINSYDANILGDDGKTDYGKTLTHLKSVLGPDLLNYLVAQAALDSSNQTATINDVIRTVFVGNKLVVYDRRFNDQLGSQ